MTYSLTSTANGLAIFYGIPIPYGELYSHEARTLHCYRVEIDSNNMVKNYRTGSSAAGGIYNSCQKLLTNDWKLPDLAIHNMLNRSAQSQFDPGDLISMTTDKEITIASTKVTSLKMAVVESDSTKIAGRLSGFLGHVDEKMENKIGSVVEIMRVDIENIWFEVKLGPNAL